MSKNLDIDMGLHDKQLEVALCKSKRIVVSSGRRAGKSYFSRKWAQIELLKGREVDGRDLIDSPILYVAPTITKAIKYMWRPMLRELSAWKVLKKEGVRKKMLEMELINGRQIWLASADNPDSLRGDSLAALIIDETKDVKKEAIEEAVLPALIDCDGPALFLGSPKKHTYFEQLYRKGISDKSMHDDWTSFNFTSYDNPTNSVEAIERYKRSVPDHIFRQEIMGEFTSSGGDYFKEEQFPIISMEEVPRDSEVFITVDLCGFTNKAKSKWLDETVIAVTAVSRKGWCILDCQHGRWGARETALRIIKSYKTWHPIKLGIEVGSLKNALDDYLSEYMARLNSWFHVWPLKSRQANKYNRIKFACQGRAEHGRMFLVKGNWNTWLIGQFCDFPDPLSHDDGPDAIAYTDQLSESGVFYGGDAHFDTYDVLDNYAGY